MRPSTTAFVRMLVPSAALLFAACESRPDRLSGLLSPRGSLASPDSGDFEYIVNPPHVAVSPSTVIPDALPFCNTSIGPLICYPPSFIRAAYHFPKTPDGTGQTILIVDAFGSPTIAHDLAVFDAAFHLPAPPSFSILCPDDGCPVFDPTDTRHDEVGWSIETSLDVEYAHAMAPGANIVLVVASTNSGNALNVAEALAIQRFPGSVMSQSFGIPEIVVHNNNAQIMQAHKNYLAAQAAGITVLASAGDFGATNGFATPNALFPSSDPLVTAVGGTQGNPYPGGLAGCGSATCTGGYGGEQVWNEPAFGAAGGGAPSLLFGAPPYQASLGLSARATPDISYNAAVNGGVLVRWSAVPSAAGFYIVGGTSAGSPQWAAIVALANQANHGPLGFINTALYALAQSEAYSSDFHDITVGDNTLVGTPFGFNAGPGWDDASGWGTPNVANLVPDLVKCTTTGTCP